MSRSLAKCQIYMEIWAMEMTKSFMEKVKKMRVKEERRNLAKAVLITDHQEARGWPYIHR